MNRKRLLKLFWLLTVLVLAAGTFAPAGATLAATEARFDVKFSGVIDEAPAAAESPWTIAGQSVAVNHGTRVVLTTGTAEPGMWADVMAQRQEDGSLLALRVTVFPPEVRLKGPVTAKPDDPDGLGSWTIAGQTIIVTEETRISTRGGSADEGDWVEVYAHENPAGTLVAQRIRGIEMLPAVEIFGAIQGADPNWLLSSIPLTLDDQTLISGEPQEGLLGHVAATLQDDGSLLVLRWRVSWTEPDGSHPDVMFIGTVEALPEGGLEGTWTISGRSVLVTSTTAINEAKGLVEVGARVHVLGQIEDEQIVATRITVLSCSHGSCQYVSFTGVIEAMPPEGLFGEWTISGRQVEVNERTRVVRAHLAQVGVPVAVGAIRQQDGTLVATWLRVLRTTGSGPHPTGTPGPGPRPTRTPRHS